MASLSLAEAGRLPRLLGLVRAPDLAAVACTCAAWRAPACEALGGLALLEARPFDTWLEPADEDDKRRSGPMAAWMQAYHTLPLRDLSWLRQVPATVLTKRRNGVPAALELLRDIVSEGLQRKYLDTYHERKFEAALALLELPAVDVDATLDVSEMRAPDLMDFDRFCLYTTDGMAAVHMLPWLGEIFRGFHQSYEQKLRSALEHRSADFAARDADGRTEADLVAVAQERVEYTRGYHKACMTRFAHAMAQSSSRVTFHMDEDELEAVLALLAKMEDFAVPGGKDPAIVSLGDSYAE